MKPTSYKDINEVLCLLKKGLINVLGEDLVALYLTGSLVYGGFNRRSSDIDFFVVTKRKLSKEKLREIVEVHNDIGKLYPEWRKRIEGSYVTKRMLSDKKPPNIKRPYFNAGKIWYIPFGNEWIIYLHQLYKYGVTLYGSDPRKIIPEVSIQDVIKASKENLLDEWKPKLSKPLPFENPDYNRDHLQAYAIMTMCRVLYTANNKKFSTKKEASIWAKKKYSKTWGNLIDKAIKWKHGVEMNVEKETLAFIKFTIDMVCN